VLRILRGEQPEIEITLASQSSPELAGALMRGKLDVALLRRRERRARYSSAWSASHWSRCRRPAIACRANRPCYLMKSFNSVIN
jgi:hypothetical protein